MTFGQEAPVFDESFRERLGTLFQWRRDVRHFRADPICPDLLESLLQMAALAPSVGLSEPWRFVVVADPARREAVRLEFERCNAAALCDQTPGRAAAYARLKLAGLDQAPCHIAVCAEPEPEQGDGLGRQTMQRTTDYSAVMAIHTLWLAARTHGLGLGWVSILDPATVLGLLDLPQRWALIGYLCLGYPAHESDVPELQRLGWQDRQPMLPKIIRR